jgi:hypothetical protein
MNQQFVVDAIYRRITGRPIEEVLADKQVSHVGIVPLGGLPCPYVAFTDNFIFCTFDPLRQRSGKGE